MGNASEPFVDRCRELAPVLAQHAVQGEAERRVPETVMNAVTDADILRAIVPASLGGHGLGLAEICEGTRELARGCPASAWTMSFLMLHAWMLGRFDVELRDELFGHDPAPRAAAPLAPTGTLVGAERDGVAGFVVAGRWEWATAVHHADWVMVHAIDLASLESGEPITRFALVPVAEVRIDDVWQTSGMRATGSDTVVVDDVFVPAHRTILGTEVRGVGAGVDDDRLAALPMLPVLALVASAPALGAAEAAVEAYRARIAERVLAYSLGDRAADQPAAQSRLAAVMVDLDTALAGWRAAIAEIAAVGSAIPDRASDLLRVRTRLAAASAVRSARRIIGDVGEGAGAGVYFSDHPHQRLQRDVETLKGHVVFDWDRTTELAGRVALGHPLQPTDLA